ncbi:G-type lectin S-receptor-like serine/threonine-protein kinase SD3-1 isoform X2 [Juglans microcarpa x Juglans regia]|nr:G-type lectin S-receptor-like serine/threonine-protein kinase SD3-1 isoform X2 [Juglans microcarpa x Juglans regia]XP_041025782.1 G-type lectin S-receptor-like serine/threonine-protein kinase SD3-1 isoform X2 [Juglans microcarpa x Juglans regia]
MLKRDMSPLDSPFLLCFSIGLSLLTVVVGQIPLGSNLSVAENNFWVSSNGDFALGFFDLPDQPNQYSIGICFKSDSIPVAERKVIWVAGVDVTVGNKSYFQLSQNGELFLFDSVKGMAVWTSQTSMLSVVSAVLRDDGNLVLLNSEKDVRWQSFDTPSDTLLPGQTLSVFQTLRAASRNSTSSYFSLYVNASGQLQLRWESHVIYWTGGSPISSNVTASLTSSGALQLRDHRLKLVWSVFGQDHNDSVKYRFLRLDVDGNLRLYSWAEASHAWRSVWQAVENQCNVFATCGQRGICALTSTGSSDCKCPFKVTTDYNSKCLVPYQQCQSNSNMMVYKHTNLYGIYPPEDSVILTSLQQCENFCVNDPHCTVATFTNDGSGECRLKRTQYVTGYSDASVRSISFVKRCSDPLAVNPNLNVVSPAHSPPIQSYKHCIPCLIGVSSGTLAVFFVFQLVFGFFIYKRRTAIRKRVLLAYTGHNSKGLIVLSFSELKDLTGNFKCQMGPKMFKGTLPNNQPVAIKDLKGNIEERKFRSVVSKIGNIHHKNLVKLEGYCCELSHRLLVYEYVKNGSVERYIEDSKLSKRLDWRKRIDICLSVARAVCYLHAGCREFVSHGNLKCENVVLDENLEAKVTEFGLWRVNGEASNHEFSAEKDVKDFGEMVLRLVSGCRAVENLGEWAYKEWMEGQAENVVDKAIDSGANLEELERALRVAFWCLQSNEFMRPSMGEVVKVLEGTLTVDPPPPPFFRRPVEVEEDSSE